MIDKSFLRRLKIAWKFLTSKAFASWTVYCLKYAFSVHEKVRGHGSADLIIWSERYLNEDIFSAEDLREFYTLESKFDIPVNSITSYITQDATADELRELLATLKNIHENRKNVSK